MNPHKNFFFIIILMILGFSDSFGQAGFVQSNFTWNSGTTTGTSPSLFQTNTLSTVSTTGNLIVVHITFSGQVRTVSTITDNKGNSYNRINGPTLWGGAGYYSSELWYAYNITGGAGNITTTVTLSGTGNLEIAPNGLQFIEFSVNEFSGIAAGDPLDQNSSSDGDTGVNFNSGSAIVTYSNELIFGAAVGGSMGNINNGATFTSINSSFGNQMEYKIGGAAGGSYSADFNPVSGGTYVAQMATFRSSGTGYTGPGGVGTTDGASNLELWLDANTITGLSDGASVNNWADISGNGLTASSSGTTMPTYDANTVNSIFPSISFDGGDFLNLGDQPSLDFIPGTDSWSFFIVYNVPGATLLERQGTFFAKAGETGQRQYQYTIDDQAGGTSRFTSIIAGTFQIGSIPSTGAWFVSSHMVAANRDSWTNEGVNFAASGVGTTYTAGLDVLIGARRDDSNTNTGFHLMGSIAEIAMYSAEANAAERIIITNYLAAKYDITIANDVYTMDNNGFDFEVAGIGQASDGSNHTDAQGTGIVRILNASNLGNNEFLMWGHDNGVAFATETTDVPAGVVARLNRVWRVSESNASGTAVDVGSIDVLFDLAGLGPVTASDLVLLVDSDNDATFADETPISGADLVSGSVYSFTGVSAIADNLRFTLGTANALTTPLPIELISFSAKPTDDKGVQLFWITASEIDNDFFTLERSADGLAFYELTTVPGAGNSNVTLNYSFTDKNPFFGISYYRLKQTDYDGQFTYSDIISIKLDHGLQALDFTLFPNPTKDKLNVQITGNTVLNVTIEMYDAQGQQLDNIIVSRMDDGFELDVHHLSKGIYLIHLINDQYHGIRKFVKN